MTSLTITPIGLIRTPYHDRYAAPSQPGLDDRLADGKVILDKGNNFEQALEDLDGFEKIWLIYCFDRNPNWKPKVQVPRGPRAKRGVFATRSPHRPNPIGLSVVTLLGIQGRTLHVRGVDMLDKTPLLDIKPYLPATEAFPDASTGWLEEIGQGVFHIYWDPAALSMAQTVPTLVEHCERILSQDPLPHPYRRIKRNADGSFTLAMKYWRVQYVIDQTSIMITRVSELPGAVSV
jgi:tRNA-Thr(GGU) m(6)t(6)A37 methyltransferase TsaA